MTTLPAAALSVFDLGGLGSSLLLAHTLSGDRTAWCPCLGSGQCVPAKTISSCNPLAAISYRLWPPTDPISSSGRWWTVSCRACCLILVSWRHVPTFVSSVFVLGCLQPHTISAPKALVSLLISSYTWLVASYLLLLLPRCGVPPTFSHIPHEASLELLLFCFPPFILHRACVTALAVRFLRYGNFHHGAKRDLVSFQCVAALIAALSGHSGNPSSRRFAHLSGDDCALRFTRLAV